MILFHLTMTQLRNLTQLCLIIIVIMFGNLNFIQIVNLNLFKKFKINLSFEFSLNFINLAKFYIKFNFHSLLIHSIILIAFINIFTMVLILFS